MFKRFDPTLKSLVEGHPPDWLLFSGRTTQAPVEAIDSDLSTVTAAADKILRVHDPIPWLLHLELQAGHDPELVERLQWYNTLLGYRHRQRVRTVLILLRPQADSPRLTGFFQQQFPDEEPYLEFCYRVVRLWQVPAEQLLSGGPGIVPLALLGAAGEESLPSLLRRMDERLATAVNPDERATLLTAAFVLAGLRMNEAAATQLFQGVPYMEESTTYQMILRQGKNLGDPRRQSRRGPGHPGATGPQAFRSTGGEHDDYSGRDQRHRPAGTHERAVAGREELGRVAGDGVMGLANGSR